MTEHAGIVVACITLRLLSVRTAVRTKGTTFLAIATHFQPEALSLLNAAITQRI